MRADADGQAAAEAPRGLLRVEGLTVELPDGRALLRGLDLEVRAGEVVAILGASGSGKSTLGRVLFEPDTLARLGFRVSADRLEVGPAALVPQHGAPLDHLDVQGNVRLALHFRDGAIPAPAAEYLRLVGLPEALAAPGVSTARLSGGQMQRLAVARALAGGRDLLFLDEPSAGLDPHAAAGLAALLRRQAREAGAGIVLVTHDTLLAAEAADRWLILDPAAGRLVPVEVAAGDRAGLEAALRDALERATQAETVGRRRRPRLGPRLAGLWARTLASLEVPVTALVQLAPVRPRQLGDLLAVARRVLAQALLRPAAFYALVSVLLGFTILYILVRAAPAGLSPGTLLRMVGGSYVLALAPPLSALLFVATSGSAVNAWLGSLALGRQLTALRALGVRTETYLWLPAFVGLALAFLASAAIICAGLLAGGAIVHVMQGVDASAAEIYARLAGDLVDPVPERAALRARAVWLFALYAPGIASDVVRRGTDLKRAADDVTRAMTGSVVASTLWVVALELLSALVLFATGAVS